MGSSAFVDPASLAAFLVSTDGEGVSFEIERDATLATLPEASRVLLGRPVQAYVEAHIEQGPILEASGCKLGVVTGIQGVRWFEITVRGSSAHAGTTPHDNRRDALMAAATMVSRIGDMAVLLKDPALRVTVGRFDAAPGSINTVADHVTFTIDLRHPDEATLVACEYRIREIVAEGVGNCVAKVRRLMQRPPTVFADELVSKVEAAVAASGEPYCRLVSGAFHDAMHLADVCPTAMLFVPSHGGISHNAAEDTDEADLIAGARVLAGVLTEMSS